MGKDRKERSNIREIKLNQIKGYENLLDCYLINELGECQNIQLNKNLKILFDKDGYRYYSLKTKDKKHKIVKIHRVLAEWLVPNPDNLPMVRHLNDNKNDWRIENLAWGTKGDNERDYHKNGGIYRGDCKEPKSVLCVETGIIYRSAYEAYRQTGIRQSHINACCRNEYGHKSAGGYHWKFVEGSD